MCNRSPYSYSEYTSTCLEMLFCPKVTEIKPQLLKLVTKTVDFQCHMRVSRFLFKAQLSQFSVTCSIRPFRTINLNSQH